MGCDVRRPARRQPDFVRTSVKKLWLLFLAGATAAFALATIAPANVAVVVNIRVALSKTDLKPNPLMMRHAMRLLGCSREETAIIGDRMDTDIIAGIHSEIDTVLVLSGVTAKEDLKRFAYRPRYILPTIGEIPGSEK